ncbi:MAG TPA: GNAT family N-acetyltransferase [Dongiaceae bacterium]|nr:GNAT family N-acetyltransferase [Dongiaceae bacterium]
MSREPDAAMTHRVRLLAPAEAAAMRDALADLLVDAVEGGASVNFIWPMTGGKAARWWDGALAGHARGERLIFIAERDGRIDGTVQLIPAPQENQPHRADLAKMLVHRRARRQGLGGALLRAAEDEARRLGRTLLTLDTESGSAGEKLYASQGWIKFGEVPGYALRADGNAAEPASFFYKLLS